MYIDDTLAERREHATGGIRDPRKQSVGITATRIWWKRSTGYRARTNIGTPRSMVATVNDATVRRQVKEPALIAAVHPLGLSPTIGTRANVGATPGR